MHEVKQYNPDILSFIANLSSDEVFTPPKVVNHMLDFLPEQIWQDKQVTFLDPVCKSGVFLREIAKRLVRGLEQKIPNLQERINHIYTKQLYGIAITELTALLSRRSVYCSRFADGKYSVTTAFDNPEGNIIFNSMHHKWHKEKCTLCSAKRSLYDRSIELESHAYQFIHTDTPEEMFNMKFDIIIGNPPYQLGDGGFGRSSSPIYHFFVQQAKKINPRYLVMITPSRWFGGGKGLGKFREEMLNDDRIRKIVDYEDAKECFPGVDIAGGISYFLWDRDNRGNCEVQNIRGDNISTSVRPLNEFKTFIRHGRAISIINKIIQQHDTFMNGQVSSRKPFGLSTLVRPMKQGDIILFWQNGEGPYESEAISVGRDLISKWKVITSYVGYDHAGNPGKDGKRKIFSRIEILPPKTICNETYLVIGSFNTKKEAENLRLYMKTIFFRFLISQCIYSHHITREMYSFVPVLDLNQSWDDEKLYRKYGLTGDEVAFIESMIRPLE